MDVHNLLQNMCREVLSEADIKGIRKSRGFSERETATRALLETFFLSDIGVAQALATLSPEETATLHLLKHTGKTVDVSFFARTYGVKTTKTLYGYTFTQRHQEVFKKTQAGLVRKGVLLIAEDKFPLDATRMERWRFRFPHEFERFLPPIVPSARTFDTPGDFRADVLRQKVVGVLKNPRPSPLGKDDPHHISLVNGDLRVGERPFHVEYLQDWQRSRWQIDVSVKKDPEYPSRPEDPTLPPIEAALYVLAQLQPREWIRPEELAVPLQIFCPDVKTIKAAEICQTGWQWGYLARYTVDGQSYYRLPVQPHTITEADASGYLQATAEGAVTINLQSVPYSHLEEMDSIAYLTIAGDRLLARPSLIKMGNAPAEWRARPLAQWLKDNSPAFGQALATVQERWGKQIIHENLLIARVTDLGLRVQIQRALPDLQDLVLLSDEYIAFPSHLLPTVEKLVLKSGHVVKSVVQHGE